MKTEKNFDTATIICFVLIVVFLIGIIIYFLVSNNINNNNKAMIEKPKMEEHNHVYVEPSVPKTKIELVEIGTYTTRIYDDDKNRVYNIELACKTLDGHKVKSGDEFSFNDTLGNMGAADGYKKALGFDSNGNDIKVYGGGICQISSTLYNAVLAAKLEVTERHAHSKRVYYVPKDKDATVFAGGPDLKFKNTLDNDIIICSTTDGYEVTVTLKEEKTITY